MQNWVEGAHAALEASGAAIRPYFRAGLAADDKSDESPVTVADRKAEEILRARLLEAFPDCGIIGEEFPPHRPDQKYVWVIDPIDGTRAFITGRTTFCTLLGLLEDGVPVLGFIDQPITRERWWGGRGVPAAFTGPFGGRVGTRQDVTLADAEFSSTAPEMFTPEQMARLDRLKGAAKRVYWGGDAYAYGLLALGQIDVVAECSLKPWDWAALGPVIEAAGGVVSDWAGRPLRLGVTEGDVVAAANAGLHGKALAALYP
ncbi:MAG TPA: inositol monophosphatase family protein [Acidocella sp.]|jgi:myo-inositol-1(or 4)-monophosphatase|nr:inositol monophosphatase family protein [Acidocella sp.]